MNSKISVILLIVFTLASSCNSYNNEKVKLKRLLAAYDKDIGTKVHLYILKSPFSCSGCLQSSFLQLNKVIRSPVNNITIIGSTKESIPESLLSRVVWIDDSKELIDRIFFESVNVIFIETRKSNIVNYKCLTSSNQLELPDFVLKFIKH